MVGFLTSIVAVLLFAGVLWKTAILSTARGVITTSMAGISTMLDSELDDDAKEQAVRSAAFALFGRIWQFSWRFALSLTAAALPLFAADLAGLVEAQATLGLMMRLDYILGVSVAAVALGWLIARLKKRRAGADDLAAANAESSYDTGDRFVHMLAFASPGLQRAAGTLDDRLFRGQLNDALGAAPIFITSLARGGTTALLNAFHPMPQIATHEYRDMPFITAPMLWSKFSSSRKVVRRERAHGDGLEIDLDSPEAFDEVFWRLYWPEKYGETSIALWQKEDGKPEARDVMLRHFCKIVMLRRKTEVEAGGRPRYMSKNNANIARLRFMKTMFPDCEIVVPLRRPAAHAASLLRQHCNFTEQQRHDEFIRRYMRDIGHLEFGLLHRPIAFEGFAPGKLKPETADYWLQYWITAFQEVRAKGQYCHIVTQDSLRAEPGAVMQALCARLDLAPQGHSFVDYFRSEPDLQPGSLFSADLLAQADALYEDLASGAVG